VKKFIEKVINRIPKSIFKDNNIEILIVDDCSKDNTLEIIKKISEKYKYCKVNILSNKNNLGYGGNQKVGYQFAIKNNFKYVVLLHGDGQYAPEKLPDILKEFKLGQNVIQASRMIKKINALKGGMPFYKFIGNIFLTFIQNRLTGLKLSEFHSGYRAYSVNALKQIPFELNSNYFEFDTEILIQLNIKGYNIKEIEIPTFYGDEISYLNSFKYGLRILKTTTSSYLNKFNIFYDRKYDINKSTVSIDDVYREKFDFDSPHSLVVKKIPIKSKVLDIACDKGYVGNELKIKRNCYVEGIDYYEHKGVERLDKFIKYNLDENKLPIKIGKFDYILLLDILEHLKNPELFLNEIYKNININSYVYISVPNVAHFIIRIMLLFGKFNYGKSGILDKTHTRLFTKKTIENLIIDSNFEIIECNYTPIPFPLIVKNSLTNKILLGINKILIAISKTLFSFQFVYKIKAKPSLEFLLEDAKIN